MYMYKIKHTLYTVSYYLYIHVLNTYKCTLLRSINKKRPIVLQVLKPSFLYVFIITGYKCLHWIFSPYTYGTVHEKIAPLIYYKNVIKMHHVCIAITSQRLTLSTSYFHHFILHHFSTVKCILESWTISVPTFLRAIRPGVQNYHIFV